MESPLDASLEVARFAVLLARGGSDADLRLIKQNAG